MNTTDLNATQNTPEEDDAAERKSNRHAANVFIFLLYSLNALVIGANIQVWGDLFGIL